jgi:hypothetical protein
VIGVGQSIALAHHAHKQARDDFIVEHLVGVSRSESPQTPACSSAGTPPGHGQHQGGDQDTAAGDEIAQRPAVPAGHLVTAFHKAGVQEFSFPSKWVCRRF